ncbi:hypothetical protein KIH77_09155 [Bifidobacterium sp. 82T24]|uniref:HTH domain-containing protein n=1 Tax=Bifidobacterium pluvialisilvae TaxID=2834436 RepID=UPI001C565BAE|nr:HTH domain-containing protein [Bifidobacterium pluvialisilvae]MBW3088887.1 hypothetical protein [Bifidobacterium pluvialisilvae]
MVTRNGKFTRKEIAYLRSLPAVASVVDERITYSETFKYHCMERYAHGESPVQIFRDSGLDSSLIGYKRIERCIARWRRTVLPRVSGVDASQVKGHKPGRRPGSTNLRTRNPNDSAALREMLLTAQLQRLDKLEREIRDLRVQMQQELDRTREEAKAELAAAETGGAEPGIESGASRPAADVVAEDPARGE